MSLPKRTHSQRTGRRKLASPEFQRMRRGCAKPSNTAGRCSVNTATRGCPGRVWRCTSQVPAGVVRVSRSATGVATARAKPSAARVGLPAVSKAAFVLGPRRSINRSGSLSATLCARSARRRGPHQDRNSATGRLRSASILRTPSARACASGAWAAAGNSSVPISISRSCCGCGLMGPHPRGCLHATSGPQRWPCAAPAGCDPDVRPPTAHAAHRAG